MGSGRVAGKVAAAILVTVVAACTTGGNPSTAPSEPTVVAAPVTAAGCLATRIDGPLPVWAQGGFHPPTLPMGHVFGLRHEIIAILWGGPRTSLYAPPRPNAGNNKILWVSRVTTLPGAPMLIRATLNGTSRTVSRVLPQGPAPSQVNLPAPGCWTLHLRWSGHTDQLQLWYTAS